MPLRWDDFDRAVLPRVPAIEWLYRHSRLYPYIDVQPALRPGDFYETGVHWRASGHRAVAAYIAARLPPAPAIRPASR